MTLQQWLFSYRGRLGRRDFWIWQALWLVLMIALFSLAGVGWLDTQMAAFMVVCLLWPTSATVVKRLHDRNRRGYWALLLVVAWMLLAGNWSMLDGTLQWLLGRLLPTVIFLITMLELGVFTGTQGDNRYGAAAKPVLFLPEKSAHQ